MSTSALDAAGTAGAGAGAPAGADVDTAAAAATDAAAGTATATAAAADTATAAAARSAYVAGFATRPGAVGTPPQHYGNPLGEQKALASGSAIVDLHDRAVISVTGPDRLTWLDSLTSQSLAGMLPGDSAETLLLDPTGRIEHAIRVVDDGVSAWLLIDGSEAASLVAWLERMRFMLRVTVALETDRKSVV